MTMFIFTCGGLCERYNIMSDNYSHPTDDTESDSDTDQRFEVDLSWAQEQIQRKRQKGVPLSEGVGWTFAMQASVIDNMTPEQQAKLRRGFTEGEALHYMYHTTEANELDEADTQKFYQQKEDRVVRAVVSRLVEAVVSASEQI
jgi:hypothetical protein